MVQIASTDFHGMFYPGGAFSLASALFWAVRSRGTRTCGRTPGRAAARSRTACRSSTPTTARPRDVPFFNDWVTHPAQG